MELSRNRTNRIDIDIWTDIDIDVDIDIGIGVIGDLLWELAYVIMEARKSHSVLSASWRTRGIPSECKSLRTVGTNDISPRVQRPKNREL